jgi:hypothetical protein
VLVFIWLVVLEFTWVVVDELKRVVLELDSCEVVVDENGTGA